MAAQSTKIDPSRLDIRAHMRIRDIRSGGSSPRSEELFAGLTGTDRLGLEALCAAVKRLHNTRDRDRPGAFIKEFLDMVPFVDAGTISAADVLIVLGAEAVAARLALAMGGAVK